MIEWYNGLTQSLQVWTILLLVLCTIGIVRCIWLCLCSWFFDISFISKYIAVANSYFLNFRNNENIEEESEYLVRRLEKITDILGKDRIDYPEIDLVSGIKYNSFYSPFKVDSIIRLLRATCLEWDERRKRKRWHYLLQLLFPILFWLLRGIEAILQFIAYLIKELGWNYNDEKKVRLITILSYIFTFITGMASLLSYMKIELFKTI